MALSGSVRTTDYDGRYLKLDWTAKQNGVANTSTISWTLSAVGGNSTTYATGPVRVRFAPHTGVQPFYVYDDENRSQQPTGVIASGSTTIEHKTNGTLTVTMIVVAAIFMTSVNREGDGVFVIDPITQTPTAPTDVVITTGAGAYASYGDTIALYWLGSTGVIRGYEWTFRWRQRGVWSDWATIREVVSTATIGSASQPITSVVNFAGDDIVFRVRACNGDLKSEWRESNILRLVGGLRIKSGGAWRQGTALVRVNGAWKRAKHVFIKKNGIWEESI